MGLEIEIEGDSEPAVALALLKVIMQAEGKDEDGADAEWILATYARCFAAVTGELAAAMDGGDEEDEPDDEDEDEEEMPGPGRNPA
jgi:hypothetical protein